MAFRVFNQPIQMRRPVQGTYVRGVWTDFPPVVGVLQTSVQPVTPSQLQLLPEGRRLHAKFTLFSRDEIQEGDEVLILGTWYEVLGVAPWQNGILPHYLGIAVKKQQENVT